MHEAHDHKQKHHQTMRVIRNVYLYLVSMIGMITMIFGAVGLVNNVFSNFVFQVNDNIYTEPYPGSRSACLQPYVDPADPELKKMIKPTAEEAAACEKNQKEQNEQYRRNSIGREFSIAIAQLAVGLPVWLFHWGVIQKEYARKKDEHEDT